MKKLYFFLIATLLSVPQLVSAQCSSCTVTISSNSSSDMNFTSGTYCFTSGTFTGNISGLSTNATICIGPNATFRPGNVNGALDGTIRVYGDCQLPAINIGNNFTVENYKNLTFNGNLNFNGSNARFNNYAGGYMLFTSSFQLNNAGAINNAGNMQFNSNFNTSSGTSVYSTGKIRLNGDFNPAGAVLNQGLLVAQNIININNGADVTNTCKFVSVKGFNNNGYFKNNGLVWITSANADEAHMQNNGTIESGAKSTIRGIKFTNNAIIKGAGKFHFTGITTQQGTFTGTNTSSPIVFYDASQYQNFLFDFPQANQSFSNVMRLAFTPEDTTSFDCAATVLPLQLTSFDAQTVQNKAVLLSWQTASETNVKSFTLERTNNLSTGSWQTVSVLSASGNSSSVKTYQYTDKAPLNGISYYRLRATDADGKETLSTLRQVNLNIKNSSIQLYPTLLQKGGMLKVLTTETVSYQMLDMSGKAVANGKCSNGANFLPIHVNAGSYIIVLTDENNIRQYSKILVQ